MRQLAIVLGVLLAALACPWLEQGAHAFWQSRDTNYGRTIGAGGGGYVGPGDIKTAANPWCGLRAYSGAAAAGLVKAIRIRRASDNAESDFNVLANGHLDTTSINTFINATTGFISVCYDQSGNAADLPQATAANQCQYFAAGANGVGPAFQCQYGAADQRIGPGTITSTAQPYSMAGVADWPSFATPQPFPTVARNGNAYCGANTSGNPYGWETNTFTGSATMAVATWYVLGCTFNGSGTSSLVVNGSAQTGGTFDSVATGTVSQFFEGYNSFYGIEGGHWPSAAFSAADHLNIAHNACVFWGFGGPC